MSQGSSALHKSSKIYVAGHRGLVGSLISQSLRDTGYGNIITRKSAELDLRRQSDTESFFSANKPEYVFLAAAKVGGILANSKYKAEFIYDNLSIALNVVNAAYKSGVRKLLNLGSSCIYPRDAVQPMKEVSLLTGPLERTNEPYAIAKIAALKLCRYYNEQYGTDFLTVMPTNLYGPYDNFELTGSHVLPALIRKFHLAKLLREGNSIDIENDLKAYGNSKTNPSDGLDTHLIQFGIAKDCLSIWGTGEPYREFLYNEDLAEACIFLMENHSAKDIGELINIGTGRDIKIKDLALLIKDIVGFKGDIKFDTSKPDGTPRKLLDVSRMQTLGWEAKTRLKEGIEKTYGWYLKAVSKTAS